MIELNKVHNSEWFLVKKNDFVKKLGWAIFATLNGELAQLARASRRRREGRGFDVKMFFIK